MPGWNEWKRATIAILQLYFWIQPTVWSNEESALGNAGLPYMDSSSFIDFCDPRWKQGRRDAPS